MASTSVSMLRSHTRGLRPTGLPSLSGLLEASRCSEIPTHGGVERVGVSRARHAAVACQETGDRRRELVPVDRRQQLLPSVGVAWTPHEEVQWRLRREAARTVMRSAEANAVEVLVDSART